ncbi:MAG TPA: tetratricopeptide repeat protein [Bacteroidota bacterium]|nr:tetratricopeptide repeat protein [Bacteroidota bacterium]
MRLQRIALLLLLAVTARYGVVRAQSVEELFSKGNDDYRAGKFTDAVSDYQQIIDRGTESAAVYFNLGNAYYRQGKIGEAILNYERAHRLSPGDPDIAHNLRLVNLKTLDRIETVPDLFLIQWLHAYAAFVPAPTAFTVLLVSWALLFTMLAAIYVVRSAGIVRLLRWTVLAAVVLLFFSATTMGVHALLSRDNDEAIVTVPIATAKSSPDNQSVNAFVVHEGLKVRVSDRLGDWIKITLADGKVGWIEAGQCERI